MKIRQCNFLFVVCVCVVHGINKRIISYSKIQKVGGLGPSTARLFQNFRFFLLPHCILAMASVLASSDVATPDARRLIRGDIVSHNVSNCTIYGSVVFLYGNNCTVTSRCSYVYGNHNILFEGPVNLLGCYNEAHCDVRRLCGTNNTVYGNVDIIDGDNATVYGNVKVNNGVGNTIYGTLDLDNGKDTVVWVNRTSNSLSAPSSQLSHTAPVAAPSLTSSSGNTSLSSSSSSSSNASALSSLATPAGAARPPPFTVVALPPRLDIPFAPVAVPAPTPLPVPHAGPLPPSPLPAKPAALSVARQLLPELERDPSSSAPAASPRAVSIVDRAQPRAPVVRSAATLATASSKPVAKQAARSRRLATTATQRSRGDFSDLQSMVSNFIAPVTVSSSSSSSASSSSSSSTSRKRPKAQKPILPPASRNEPSALPGEPLCVACADRSVKTVGIPVGTVPCGHACLCITCAYKLRPLVCPMCRCPWKRIIRIYLPAPEISAKPQSLVLDLSVDIKQ